MNENQANKFYKRIDKMLTHKMRKEFVVEFKSAATLLINQYETNIISSNENHRLKFVERMIFHIEKLIAERDKADILIKEETHNYCELIDQTYDYFYNELHELTKFKAPMWNKSLVFDFQNEIDKTDPVKVHKYFYKALVEVGYINENQFKEFILAAFQRKKRLDELIVPNYDVVRTKPEFRKVFCHYYKNIANRDYSDKPKYVALLQDYFHGFNQTSLYSNFCK